MSYILFKAKKNPLQMNARGQGEVGFYYTK